MIESAEKIRDETTASLLLPCVSPIEQVCKEGKRPASGSTPKRVDMDDVDPVDTYIGFRSWVEYCW